jgi:hypothetical protein
MFVMIQKVFPWNRKTLQKCIIYTNKSNICCVVRVDGGIQMFVFLKFHLNNTHLEKLNEKITGQSIAHYICMIYNVKMGAYCIFRCKQHQKINTKIIYTTRSSQIKYMQNSILHYRVFKGKLKIWQMLQCQFYGRHEQPLASPHT